MAQGSTCHVIDGLCFETCTVRELKDRVFEKTGVAPAKQRLVFKGTLNDAQKLAETKLRPGCKVMLMGGGGGK